MKSKIKAKKLTKYQRDGIMLIYAAMRYQEALRQKSKTEAEKQFVKDIEKVILN